MPHPRHTSRPRALETYRCEVGAASPLSRSIHPPTHVQNANLDQHIASHRLAFIDVPSRLRSSDTTLRPLYDVVRTHLQTDVADEGHTLVILDDVSALEWIGYSVVELSRFLRALSALCRKVRHPLYFVSIRSCLRTA